ncbi:MAG: serine hydrolase domain-containing protein [Chloroflexota bacterium]
MNIEHLRHAAQIADEAVKNGPQPTAVIAVADRDTTLWTHVSPGEDGVSLDSIFLIASITKPVVATAIMRLVEEGNLLLNVPVATYLPEFGANNKEHVTSWHLLTHSSGLEEDQYWGELQALTTPPPPGFLYNAACSSYLHFDPGTAYQYNSLTFSVLSELIARLGGEPYPDYLRRHIFEPLGMTSTAFSPVDPARAAPIYDLGPPHVVAGFTSLAMPGGGLWSSAADLVAFGQAYLRGGTTAGGYKLLSPPSISLMTQHYTHGQKQFVSGTSFNYGLGWGKPSSPRDGDLLASERAFGHNGASGTTLWIDPQYGFVYVFLSNRWDMVDPLLTSARGLNVVYGAVDGA